MKSILSSSKLLLAGVFYTAIEIKQGYVLKELPSLKQSSAKDGA